MEMVLAINTFWEGRNIDSNIGIQRTADNDPIQKKLNVKKDIVLLSAIKSRTLSLVKRYVMYRKKPSVAITEMEE